MKIENEPRPGPWWIGIATVCIKCGARVELEPTDPYSCLWTEENSEYARFSCESCKQQGIIVAEWQSPKWS